MNLRSQSLHLLHGQVLDLGLIPGVFSSPLHLLILTPIDLCNHFSTVSRLCLQLLQQSLFLAHTTQYFVQIDRLHQLHLLRHIFELVQSLEFCLLEIHKLMFFKLLILQFVLYALQYFVLACNVLLGALKLLL